MDKNIRQLASQISIVAKIERFFFRLSLKMSVVDNIGKIRPLLLVHLGIESRDRASLPVVSVVGEICQCRCGRLLADAALSNDLFKLY